MLTALETLSSKMTIQGVINWKTVLSLARGLCCMWLAGEKEPLEKKAPQWFSHHSAIWTFFQNSIIPLIILFFKILAGRQWIIGTSKGVWGVAFKIWITCKFFCFTCFISDSAAWFLSLILLLLENREWGKSWLSNKEAFWGWHSSGRWFWARRQFFDALKWKQSFERVGSYFGD